MKQSKRIISFVLIVCMLVATVVTTGISVSAAEVASGVYNDTTSWVLDDSGVLTISGTKMMVSGVSKMPWFAYKDSITKVVIEEGIKDIATGAFEGCDKLTEVAIPGTIKLVGARAFEGCLSLVEIVFPESVNISSINKETFKGCTSLKSFVFKGSMGIVGKETFADCPNLTKVVLPENVSAFHDDPFKNSNNVAIYGVLNSLAHTYATENNIPFFEYVEEEEPVVALPEITTNGHNVSITCADRISTIRFAEGVYEKLAQIKAAPGNVVLDKKRIDLNTTDSVFNYDIYNNGTYTFWYKMDTGESYITYVEMKDAVVTFAEAGLKITLGNLDGIMVIRTAAGEYNTANEVKYAAGARSYSANTVIKDAQTYTLQYKVGGVYTIAVIYDNGHEVIYHYNSVPQVDSVVFEQDENNITVSGLDNVKVVRYAKGEYTSSSAIKNAEGVVAVAKKYIKNNTLSISNLESGAYTVYVQMEDESFAFYNVAVD